MLKKGLFAFILFLLFILNILMIMQILPLTIAGIGNMGIILLLVVTIYRRTQSPSQNVPGESFKKQAEISPEGYDALTDEFFDTAAKVIAFFNRLNSNPSIDRTAPVKIPGADKLERLRYCIEKLNDCMGDDYFDKIQSITVIEEIYHKIPYLILFLKKVIEKTEAATNTLIDKFEIVSQENACSTEEAMKNLNSFKENAEGKSFEETVMDSKKAISDFKQLIENMALSNQGNIEKFHKIEEKTKLITQTLENLVEISNQNKVIYLNLSIEAVKLGERGRSIKVIVNEIEKLSQRTADFIAQINTIMKSFRTLNEELIEELNTEKESAVRNIETTSRQSENVVGSLISSYESTAHLYMKLTDSNIKVRQSMDQVIESLQFQDITRQQIENVMEFLSGIQSKIKEKEEIYKNFNIDLNEENEEIHEMIYQEFGKKAKVFDEKMVLESKRNNGRNI